MAALPPTHTWTEDSQFDELKELYGIYRDYMKHEDDLLNQRSTWHLLIQGFLFGTLGIIGEWQLSEHSPDRLYVERGFLVYVLALVGIAIAYAAYVSLKAANDAIDTLEERWREILASYKTPTKNLLPAIAGGGHPTAKRMGKRPSIWISRAIILAWALIATMSIIDKVRPLPGPNVPAAQSFQKLSTPLKP